MANLKNFLDLKHKRNNLNKSVSLCSQVDSLIKTKKDNFVKPTKVKNISEVISTVNHKIEKVNNKKENASSSIDDKKRLFLKVAGVAGLGLAASALFPKGSSAYVAGSTPTSNVVGIKNVANTKINPATEENQDQMIGNYALRLDDTSTANVTYLGTAPIGSATSSAVWKIKKLDETSGLVITWADGDDSFNNIWDNRTSLTYI